jgi:benzoyl-CoA reductase/2-hydroxyglutaryl-CoA dehydratase subunit BcrC/BadD/HgdB
MEKEQKSAKRLQTARELSRIVGDFYLECLAARSAGRPVGWMPPMNGAIELFYAMDLQPVFPENWSPVCAAFGLAPANFQVAEDLGYSRDLCGYLRNILGYVHGPMQAGDATLGGLPEPDLLLSAGGGCNPVMKIFHALERRFPQARVFTADLPQVPLEGIRAYHLDYARSELERLIAFLERVRDELKTRAAAGTGVIANEQIRLFWDNIPLWYNLGLFHYFEKMNAVVVAETYSAAWSLRLEVDNPLDALALKSLKSYPMVSCVSIANRKAMVLKACRDYAIDGVIFHRNKSCVPITLGQMDIKDALERELGIPAVVIDADHMDARNFSTAQFQARVDAFLEMLREKKGLSS